MLILVIICSCNLSDSKKGKFCFSYRCTQIRRILNEIKSIEISQTGNCKYIQHLKQEVILGKTIEVFEFVLQILRLLINLDFCAYTWTN